MVRRRTIIAAIGLLLLGALGVAGAGTPGTTTWAGNYRVLDLGGGAHNPQVMVAWASGDTTANLYCGVTAGPHFPPQVGDQYAWVPAWSGAQPPNTMFALTCDTDTILVATGAQPAVADLSIMGGAVSTSSATATSATSTATSSSPTPIPPTRTPAPVTATTSPTTIPTATMPPMEGMTDGGNTCGNLSDDPKAIDQNGVPLNGWAPGLRIGCGFPGFENGDDPMPAGTHLPAPRPFDFDRAVVAHESAFGFKVYYRKGSEAPAGYQGTGGCGDVRVILHQGGSVHGFTTQYHTVQIATDQCDSAGNHHILDVAGRVNTGVLDLRSHPDADRGFPDRLTADTVSCDGKTTWTCATVWYSALDYQVPGGSWDAWYHFGFLVENPISLYDTSNPNVIAPGPGNGTTTMLRDNQYDLPARSAVADWWCLFNPATNTNEIVPAGTAGAWQMHVDPYFTNVEVLEPASGTDHFHPIAGISYPN